MQLSLRFTSVYLYTWQVQPKSTYFHLYPIFSSNPFYFLPYFLIVLIFHLPRFRIYSKFLIKLIYLIFQSSSFLVNLKTQSTLFCHLPNIALYFKCTDTLLQLCSFPWSKLSCYTTKTSWNGTNGFHWNRSTHALIRDLVPNVCSCSG